MQIQSAGQAQTLAQMQQTQVRKMDGSGNGQGNRNGSNGTIASVQQPALDRNSTFSITV